MFVPLHGAHQADNAAARARPRPSASSAVPLGREVVADAFAPVRSPGRLEVVGHQPLVLLDGAHNVAGAHALRAALAEEFPASPRTLVSVCCARRSPHEMLEALDAKHADRLVCCRPPSPRALDPAAVAAAGADVGVDPARIETFDTVADAVARARAVTDDDAQIVVTGSLYAVGAARHALVHGE